MNLLALQTERGDLMERRYDESPVLKNDSENLVSSPARNDRENTSKNRNNPTQY